MYDNQALQVVCFCFNATPVLHLLPAAGEGGGSYGVFAMGRTGPANHPFHTNTPCNTQLAAGEGEGEGGGDGTLKEEDLIPNVPCLLTLSSRGYVKRLAPETFEAQRRGGKGELRGCGLL